MKNRIKKLTSVVLVGFMLFSMTACSKTFTVDSFRDALIKANIGATIANIKVSQNQAYYSRDNLELYASYNKSTDEYAALTWFQSFYERFEKTTFVGNVQTKFDKGYSYFTLNGETKDEQFSSPVGYYYGGWYCKKDTVIIVYTTLDSENNRAEVDRILTQLKYPKPQESTKTTEESTQESVVQTAVQSTTASTANTIKNETNNESTSANKSKSAQSESSQIKEIYLVDVFYEGSSLIATPNDMAGNYYGWSFGSYDQDATFTWKLDKNVILRRNGRQEYNTLKLKLSVGVYSESKKSKDKKASCVYIYADGKLIYENTNITAKTKTQPLSFDITGCKELKIRLCSNVVYPAIFEPVLCPE